MIFEVQSGGKTYEVEAPDQETAVRALGDLMKGAPQAQPVPAAEKPGVMEDVLNAAGSGLVTGLHGLAGMVGDLDRAIGTGVGMARDAILGDVSPEQRQKIDAAKAGASLLPTTADTMKATGFTPYEPKTVAGEYARTVGEFVPGAAAGGVRNLIRYGVVPAVASETAGQATKGRSGEPVARAIGAVAGGLAVPALRRAVTPFPVNAERAAAVDTLRGEGVTDLTAGQMTGNQKLRYMESELGGTAAEGMADRVGEQFTAAALRRAGVNANRATPEVIDGAFTRIGNEFDRLAAQNDMRFDRPAYQGLINALDSYEQAVPPAMRAPIVQRVGQDLAQAVQAAQRAGGVAILPGGTYQNVRSLLGKQAQTLRISNPPAAQALRDIQDALDGAMQRSIARTNPRDVRAFATARREYRNLLTIERAATAAGENAAMGIISPSQLRNATVTTQGRRNYARGRGDLADLARAGESVLKPLPQSGTAPRQAARNLVNFGPAVIGGAIGGSGGDAFGGILGAMLGAALPPAMGRAVLSAPVRGLLSNRVLGPAANNIGGILGSALTGGTLPMRLPQQPLDITVYGGGRGYVPALP